MKYLLLLIPLVFLIACGGKETDSPKTKKTAKKATASAASPSAEDSPEIDYKSLFQVAEQESLEIYNSREQQLLAAKNIGKLKADSFMRALLSPLEEGSSRKIEYGRKYGITAGPDQEFFIVLEDNLPDDSIQSDIRFFELRKTEKSWRIASVTSVWKCYKGRGHQDYSILSCN